MGIVGLSSFNPASSGICFETRLQGSQHSDPPSGLSIQLVLESVLKLLTDSSHALHRKQSFNPASSGICFETITCGISSVAAEFLSIQLVLESVLKPILSLEEKISDVIEAFNPASSGICFETIMRLFLITMMSFFFQSSQFWNLF